MRKKLLAGMGGAVLVAARCFAATNEPPSPPAEELKSFRVPPGFIIELAASEPDLPKPVTVTWDDSGRMWGVTAVEYPVDANESQAQAESLYRKGGRDRVLVFDPPAPKHSGPAVLGRPRVFADGLAIPLGVLPFRDGAYVHHGTELVFLRDTDGDGRADKREVILSGFGIQDSHLMPHQFTFAPGGWIYVAQGAFNYSRVRDHDGVVTRYDQTKLARFRPDGSQFEILTHGPCNIWGLVITRFGETWIQEANDYGYPAMRFEPGANYPGCGDTKFRPYAPMQPSIADFRMGGTGLSGLAFSEGDDCFPGAWRDVMFVANPITRQVQALRIQRGADGQRLEKLPDFMTSTDPMFRPVAIHFGPDACLYVVDWYNKIISHNEVPRNHPDRDKTRGRVWRVRHESQKLRVIPNVAKAATAALPQHLASGNKWEWNAALHQIAERQPAELAAKLATLAGTNDAALQIRALWALESLRSVEASLLAVLLKNPDVNVRREAVRVAGTQLAPDAALPLVAPLAGDADHYVRSEVIRVVSGQDAPGRHHLISGAEQRPVRTLSGAAVELLVSLARPALPDANKPGAGYEREFERYLIRAALENHAAELTHYLDSVAAANQPAEHRLLASLALPPAEGAKRIAVALPQLQRPPNDEEFALLFQNLSLPVVAAELSKLATQPASSASLANAALRLRTRLDAAGMSGLATVVARTLFASRAPADVDQALRLAGAFKARELEPEIVSVLTAPDAPGGLALAALKTLRELPAGPVDLLFRYATNAAQPAAVRTEAIAALAASRGSNAAPKLFSLWPSLNDAQRKPLIEQMSATRSGGETLLAGIRSSTIEAGELPVSALEKMRAVLQGNAQMDELWRELSARMKRTLRFNGGHGDYAATKLALAGPFTVEAWVRLDPDISNLDGILGAAARGPAALDMNFAGTQFRVWLGSGENDIVIAKRQAVADVWTHYAVTRDLTGEFRIYLNGELDATGRQRSTGTYTNLDLARTLPPNGGTAGSMTEFRVWNVARSPAEILANFDRGFADEKIPASLVRYFPAGKSDAIAPTVLLSAQSLRGNARLEGTLEAPPLLTTAEAREVARKFEKFGALAGAAGDVAGGRELFTTTCLVCHQAGGQGAGFAPNLDGSALRGTDGLLRALLTPSAAMEAGYRKYRVETKDGEIHEGFLAQQDAAGLVLRQPNAEPLKIAARDIKRGAFQSVSLMPEGLLEAMDAKQVSDLFTYLRALK